MQLIFWLLYWIEIWIPLLQSNIHGVIVLAGCATFISLNIICINDLANHSLMATVERKFPFNRVMTFTTVSAWHNPLPVKYING